VQSAAGESMCAALLMSWDAEEKPPVVAGDHVIYCHDVRWVKAYLPPSPAAVKGTQPRNVGQTYP